MVLPEISGSVVKIQGQDASLFVQYLYWGGMYTDVLQCPLVSGYWILMDLEIL